MKPSWYRIQIAHGIVSTKALSERASDSRRGRNPRAPTLNECVAMSAKTEEVRGVGCCASGGGWCSDCQRVETGLER